MFPRFLAAFAIFFSVFATTPATVHAQDAAVAQAPRNAHQWDRLLRQEIRRALRRSDTALNTTGGNSLRSAAVAITINRDGHVADVQILRSKGKAMDAAFVRSFSNMRLPPFSPDMPNWPMEFTLPVNIE